MDERTLYQRLLGAGFDALPAPLARFHGSPPGGKGSGLMTVRCGRGALRRMIARLLRLPRPGENVEVELDVKAMNGREMWRRSFDGRTMATTQWEERGLLAERAGPMTIYFRLHGGAHGMRFEQVRSTFLGIPVPRALEMRVEGTATPREAGWDLHVRVALPTIGEIISYSGHIVPIS